MAFPAANHQGMMSQQVARLGVEDLAFWHGARDRRAERDAAEQTGWRSVAARGRSGRSGRGGGGCGEGEDAVLGAVPVVVAVLAKPGASPAALVHAAAAAGSFACVIEDGAWSVLAAGAVGHLTRLLAHPDDKVCFLHLLVSFISCMPAGFGGSKTLSG